MSKHTPEPWQRGITHELHASQYELTIYDFERAVACVNHCKGATNEELDARSHEDLMHIIENEARDNGVLEHEIERLKAERDDLMQALEFADIEIEAMFKTPASVEQDIAYIKQVQGDIRKAIQKAKGGKP